MQQRLLGALFAVLAVGFLSIGLYAAGSGGVGWVIAVPTVLIAVWMGELAFKALR